MADIVTPYLMVVRNLAAHIRSHGPDDTAQIDAFEAARVIGIAFCKAQGEVLADIISVKIP